MSKTSPDKYILAIESSCDETAAAVLKFSKPATTSHNVNFMPTVETVSSVVKSQIALHAKMGGVVPETAARAHVKFIRPVVEKALSLSNFKIHDIDYIAVTEGPGLLPSLTVGTEFAKSLAWAAQKPLFGVNHMMGHLYSPLISDFGFRISDFPQVSLVVSGGHTMLVLMRDLKNYKVLGQTVDDAAGEAFDKVAKMLHLPYPGGPEVSKLAMEGNPNAINFPRPMINDKSYNFSFSGLKTAVLYYLRDHSMAGNGLKPFPTETKKHVCASFQSAVIDVLVTKTLRAAKEFKANSISLSGGVSANLTLRQKFMDECKKQNLGFSPAPLHLTGDNAEMIGLAAIFSLMSGKKPLPLKKIQANPNLTL